MISKVTENNKELIKNRLKEINEALFISRSIEFSNPAIRTVEGDLAAATPVASDAVVSEDKTYFYWNSSLTSSNKFVKLSNSSTPSLASAFETSSIKAAVYEVPEAVANLESYYGIITEIAKLTTNFHNAPYKYFLMPLDEPMFEIDANKRTIAVPAQFAKNGVGVYGDHMAEVLYFRVDKFFDYQNLFDVDEIIINWQFRGANEPRGKVLDTNTSLALAPDDTFDPGHIVFGWVITNEMTPSKGTLSFSVSFIKRVGESYKYVLNTIASSVTINDSIILDDPQKLDTLRRPVFERLSDSRYTIDNVTPLEDPVYRTGKVQYRVGNETITEYHGLPVSENFELYDDGTESTELKLQAIGYSKDDGIIQYSWHGTTSTGTSVDQAPGGTTYILTADTTPVDYIQYYVFDENTNAMLPLPLKNESDEIVLSAADALADTHIEVYEIGSALTVTEGGEYQVTMQSKKIVNQSVCINSGNVPSQTCSVPMAAVPSVALSVTQAATPEHNDFTIYDQDMAGQFEFVDGSAPTVIATIGIDESKIWDSATGEGIYGVTANSTIGAIALKMTNEPDDEGKPVASEFDGMSFVKSSDGGVLTVNSTGANVEGTYKVYAVNRRNHTYNVSDAAGPINVSYIAPYLSEINVDVLGDSGIVHLIQNNGTVNDSVINLTRASGYTRSFTVNVEDELNDAVTIKLSVVELDQEALDNGNIVYLEDEEDEPVRYEITNGDFVSARTGEFTITKDAGYFVIEALTRYNGTERKTVTEPFHVTSD